MQVYVCIYHDSHDAYLRWILLNCIAFESHYYKKTLWVNILKFAVCNLMQFAKPGANSRQMWWDTAARWTACRQGEHIPIAWNFLHGCQSPVTLILWAVSCTKMPIKRMQIPTSSWMRDHTFSWKSLESSTPSSQRCIESNQIKTTPWEKNCLCFLISSYFCHPVLKNKGDGFLGDTHQILDVKMTFEKSQHVTIQLQAKVQKQKFKCKPGQLLDADFLFKCCSSHAVFDNITVRTGLAACSFADCIGLTFFWPFASKDRLPFTAQDRGSTDHHCDQCIHVMWCDSTKTQKYSKPQLNSLPDPG